MSENRLAWLCLVCGNMTPRAPESTKERIGYCPHCYGEFEAVEIGKDDARIAEVRGRTEPIRVEVDYYAREDHGHPYHIKTTRIDVPDVSSARPIPFLLQDEVGEYHGIIRVRVVNG